MFTLRRTNAVLQYHGNKRIAMSVDLRAGVSGPTNPLSSNTFDLKVAHGALMATGFGVVMMAAVMFAMIPKANTWWFPVHWILVTVAACLILAGFVIALVFQAGAHFSTTTSQTRGAHSILGMIVISFTCWQIALGVLTNALWQADFKKTDNVPPTKWNDYLHHWVGRVVLLTATVNLFLGLVELQTQWWWYLIFGLVALAWLVVFIIILFVRRRSNLDYKQHAPVQMSRL